MVSSYWVKLEKILIICKYTLGCTYSYRHIYDYNENDFLPIFQKADTHKHINKKKLPINRLYTCNLVI